MVTREGPPSSEPVATASSFFDYIYFSRYMCAGWKIPISPPETKRSCCRSDPESLTKTPAAALVDCAFWLSPAMSYVPASLSFVTFFTEQSTGNHRPRWLKRRPDQDLLGLFQ